MVNTSLNRKRLEMSSSTFVITYDTNGGFPTQFTKELKVDDVILY